jgi:catechol 2,3-dioxygenase-like lactoylglutathione lyase family enzyme
MAGRIRQGTIPRGELVGLPVSDVFFGFETAKICVSFKQETDTKGRGAMPLQALGYVGFGSADLDDWRQFGTGLVGLQAVERSASLLAFRMDDRKQRIVIDRAMPEGSRFFGWEVADAAALDQLAARLETAGVDVVAEPRTLADARRVGGLVSFRDPAGNRLEAF